MIVTICATFQSVLVNVSTPGATVPSVVSLEVSAMVTLAVGAVLSTTAKVAVPPSSVVLSPEIGVTEMPGPTAVATTLSENSDVLPPESVAVAVTRSPAPSTPAAKVNEKRRAVESIAPGTTPPTTPDPSKVWPSP